MLHRLPIPVAAQFMAWEYGCSLAGFVSLKHVWGGGSPSLVSVVCCQAELSVTCQSSVQRSPTECGVSECDQGNQRKKCNPTKNVVPWYRNFYNFS
jgi:hypothetical protein